MERIKDNISQDDLSFKIETISSHLSRATIDVPAQVTKAIYSQTINQYKKQTKLAGFQERQIPKEYLEENYKQEIENNVKNYLFKHLVLDFLMEQIRIKRIPLTNYPRLADIQTESNKKLSFVFKISIADPIQLMEWKHFVFRPPKRKRYKDLDKQVNLFIKKESLLFKSQELNTIEENDWVYFTSQLLDEKNKPILSKHKSKFWINVNNKYLTRPFHASLIGKKKGDTFISKDLPIQNDFSEETENNKSSYLVTIESVTKGSYLSLDSLKTNFKLKSKQDIHIKLIEVFSYRNDISQRKSIIEELFHLFLSKHRFEIPKHFVIRRQEDILINLKEDPDYQVYKIQKDFGKQIEMLAEKQLKEETLIDQIAYQENIKLETNDIENYLHLFNNKRLKEFVYFRPILEKVEDSTYPLQTGILKQAVLREKTLNHIIHTLTK